MNLKQILEESVILKGHIEEETDFWVTAHCPNSGMLIDIPKKDIHAHSEIEKLMMSEEEIEKFILDNFSSADFCGCYDGDLKGCWGKGVKRLAQAIRAEMIKKLEGKNTDKPEPHCICDISAKEGFAGAGNAQQCPVHQRTSSNPQMIEPLDLPSLVTCDYGDTDRIIDQLLTLGRKINELITIINKA